MFRAITTLSQYLLTYLLPPSLPISPQSQIREERIVSEME